MDMRREWIGWWLAAFLACAWGLKAAPPHTQARLLMPLDEARPGQTITAGIELRMDRGWHTYWRNGGDAGAPTSIDWKLPPGIAAGEIQWPVPEKHVEAGLTTYVYHGRVILLVPLTLSSNLAPGAVELEAAVHWLECEKLCLPGDADVAARLTIGASQRPSPDAALIEGAQERLPRRDPNLPVRAAWAADSAQNPRPFVIAWASDVEASRVDFFPDANDVLEISGDTERPSAGPGEVRLQKAARLAGGAWPSAMGGLLVVRQESGKPAAGHEVRLELLPSLASLGGGAGPAAAAAAAGVPGGVRVDSAPVDESMAWLSQVSLARMLWYAFVGGMILNVMPCVLPVIALKILGFVNESRSEPGRVRRLGLVYAAGVMASFVVLAAIVIAIKGAGQRIGWGMQFSSPVFLVMLTTLVTLVALNLFGLFEVTMGGSVISAAGGLAGRPGAAGAFFNGVLATLLATPCTAPFLAPALGFAFHPAQSSPTVFLLLLAVGAGLAAPYVVLSWRPDWLKWLPKPGPWMGQFKVFMGFPMLATALWLFAQCDRYYGKRVLWLGMFLVVLALAAWIYGEFVQRGQSRRKPLAAGLAFLLAAIGYVYALESQLRWRSARDGEEGGGGAAVEQVPGGIPWEPWSPAAVAQARAQGRPVLVDFTADWCLTCLANKKIAIEIESVRNKLREIGGVALLGDYTTFPAAIYDELKRFGRAGVPLVLVYPRRSDQPPRVLPELLTPQIVLDALDEAAHAPE